MAVDPRAVSVFVVATEEAELEVHGALLANKIGRFVHEWSPWSPFGVWYREPDYSSLAHQFVPLGLW